MTGMEYIKREDLGSMTKLLNGGSVAGLIDQTLLRSDATIADIEKLCHDAASSGFKSVCVNPCHVRLCCGLLSGTKVLVTSVIGFPLGADAQGFKAMEAERVLRDGAQEIDMVMNIGLFKSGGILEASAEIGTVVQCAEHCSATVKVIIEASLLDDREKVIASLMVVDTGADFVKTSTGFEGRKATVEDVRLLRRAVGPLFGVKASGGISSYRDLLEMVNAGANRIGTSSGVQILLEEQKIETRYPS